MKWTTSLTYDGPEGPILSTIHNPQSTIHNQQSTLYKCDRQSTIHDVQVHSHMRGTESEPVMTVEQ